MAAVPIPTKAVASYMTIIPLACIHLLPIYEIMKIIPLLYLVLLNFFCRAMVGLAMTGKSLTFLFSTLAWWFYNPPSVATTSQREAAAPNRQTETKDVVMLYAYDNAAVDPS